MKKQFTRIILSLLILTPLVARFYWETQGKILGARVEAVGNLLITYLGVPIGDPVFEVVNFLPGDCETRTINVDNTGLDAVNVSVRSDNEIDADGLSTQLHFRISQALVDLYGGSAVGGPKLVSDFFADSGANPMGIPLSTVDPGTNVDYQFEVCFDPAAGNEYQLTSTIFDLVFIEPIIPVKLPDECKSLEGIVTAEIVGTSSNDTIIGTSASEYIRGLEGDDHIEGGGGHDCIFGGDGIDDIDAGSGNDIVVGGLGNDHLDGHSDNDIIYAGEGDDFIEGKDGNDLIYAGIGNDRVEAGSDLDTIYGEEGDDTIEAGSGNDYVEGGNGNDTIFGNSGDDRLYGQEGDDNIHGNSGDDYLDGGPGTNVLDGDSGTDQCYNGPTILSCFP